MDFEKGFPLYPDFIKIYNSHTLSQRLVIPSGYDQHYPKPLPQTAVVRKAEGNFWKVKWSISQGKTVSFEAGWCKFVKDNDLIDRDLLVFTYDGYRDFWISIYRNGLIVMTKAPINIQEISDDDEDETNGNNDNHHMEEDDDEEEDSNEKMIISLSLGTSDDVGLDDDDDDDDTCEVNKAFASSTRGRQSNRDLVDFIKNQEQYLDNLNNPFFISTSSCSKHVLVIAKQVINDYLLKFDRTIKIIDGYGEVVMKVAKWRDHRVVVNKWGLIYRRNHLKPGDVIICEVLRENNVVRSLKVHFFKK